MLRWPINLTVLIWFTFENKGQQRKRGKEKKQKNTGKRELPVGYIPKAR